MDEQHAAPEAGPGAGWEVTVRYFAAARAAAGGIAEEQVPLAEPVTEAQLFALLADRHPDPPAGEPALSTVLAESSSFVDGFVVLDGTLINPGQRVDVLPPFAGG